ncbi:MAG: hypothetical protein ABJZ55_08775 [Fuerstiella sp.]
MKRVDIIYFEASSGHKSAAEALRHGLQDRSPEWDVRCVDLGDVLKHQTRLLGWIYNFGIFFFNGCMKRERYFFFCTSIKLWVAFARLITRFSCFRFLLKWTANFWGDRAPDALISVTPMKHTIVYEAARCIHPDVLCITVPVDYSEMVSGYWFQPRIRQHYLLGCEGLKNEAFASAVPADEINELSGMIVDPRFYADSELDRDQFLVDLGLDPALPTGIISFGGQGTVNVLRCAKQIARARIPVNLICLCGRNQKLHDSVKALETPFPLAALNFTEDPPVDAHRIAEFLIGKPGTMTLNEAVITRTAFVFIKSRGLNVVQGANEQWVVQNGTGVACESPDFVDQAVRKVLGDFEMSQRIERAQHRGIFDAVQLITKMVSNTSPSF